MIVENLPAISALLASRAKNFAVVDECSHRDAALSKATEFHVDVALIDLYLWEDPVTKNVPGGLDVIGDLSKSSPETVIVAYSNAIEVGQESTHPLAMQSRAAGASYVVARDTLSSLTHKPLEHQVRTWIEERRRDEVPVESASDLDTKSAIETVGEHTLKLILRDRLPKLVSYKLRALTAGFSGAILFSVMGRTSEGDEVATVLKVSKATNALESELRRRPMTGSVFDSISVLPVDGPSKMFDGWRAFTLREITKCAPLSSFVRSGKCTANAKLTIDRVVAEAYEAPARLAQPPSVKAAPYELSWRAGAALKRTLSKLAQLSTVVSSKDRSRAADVSRFVEQVLNNKASLVGAGAPVTRLHGDLHADNVFVSPSAGPLVIDRGWL